MGTDLRLAKHLIKPPTFRPSTLPPPIAQAGACNSIVQLSSNLLLYSVSVPSMGSAVNADLSLDQETPAKETGGYAKFKLVVSTEWTATTTNTPSVRLKRMLVAHPPLTRILHDDHCELDAGGALVSYGVNRTFMTPKKGASFAKNEQVISSFLPSFLPSFRGILVPTYAALPTPFVPVLAFFLTHVRPLFLR